MNEDPPQTKDAQATQCVRLEVTWKSIFRLLLGALLTYIAILLWPIFKLLIMAILLAVALYPIVGWANRRGWPQWVGHILATLALLVAVVGCVAVLGPMLLHQMSFLSENLPRLRDQIIAQLPSSGPLHEALQNSMNPGTVADSRLFLQKTLVMIELTVGGLVALIAVLALAVYLIVDGPRALDWLILHVPSGHRAKISEALGQMSRLISSYVAGQFLISVFCSLYLFLVLTLLGVPMALLLGIVAGICDVLPIIGFFITVILAMAIGFTISPTTAVLIFVLYGAYHLFENFVIVPRVYGRQLKLSRLAVPLAVAAGGMLAGVVGAIAVLPIVAAYPVVERLWLAPKLQPGTAQAPERRTP